MSNKKYRSIIFHSEDVLLFAIGLLFSSLVFSLISSPKTIEFQSEIPYVSLFEKVLLKNLLVLFIIVFGSRQFKFIPVLTAITNGIVLGVITSQFSKIYYWALILPHGLLEISTFLYAGYLSRTLYWENHSKKKLYFLILLVALAAFIEAFITPNIINHLMLYYH